MKKLCTLLAGLALSGSTSMMAADYTLQLLHASDLEGGVNAIGRAPNFAAIIEHLENNPGAADGTLIISGGDNYIPGPFFTASSDFSLATPLQEAYEALFGISLFDAVEGSEIETRNGAIDITIMNIIGFDASALGNHEFDLGSEVLRDLLEEEYDDDRVDASNNIVGAEIEWHGAQFPYLAANLDFSGDGDLSGIATSAILPRSAYTNTTAEATGPVPVKFPVSQGNSTKIAPATVAEVNGELIGIVGGTTQRLNQISSPSGTVVIGANDNNIPLLATQLQTVIDDVINGDDDILGTADDVNKVILTTHLQQLSLEQQLASLLRGVDVIIAGGSDTLLADGNDTLRSGDVAAGTYPVVETDLDGNPTLIVSTDGEYSYVGRLNVPFTAAGIVDLASLDDTINGPIATLDTVVSSLWGDLIAPFQPGTRGGEVLNLVNPVQNIVDTQDSNIFGYTAYFLDGTRGGVRTEETNLGNLTADANLWKARQVVPDVDFSFKNGGGIRNPIGEIDPITGATLPPQGNPKPSVNKPVGAISELDIADVLRFNNGLVVFELSGQDILEVLEHGFGASIPGTTQGRFPQVAGLQVSYSPPDGINPVEIRSFALTNDDGSIKEVIYKDGAFMPGKELKEYKIVTLNFLATFGNFGTPGATAGDGYPFPGLGQNLNDLGIGEQQAIQEYLSAFFPTPELAFSQKETEPVQDMRIQNLDERLDSIGVRQPVYPAGALRMEPVATYESGIFDDSAAEIVAYDAGTQRLFSVSSAGQEILVIDASDPVGSGLPLLNTIAAPGANLNPNSVDVYNGIVAVCWNDDTDAADNPIVARGKVTLYDAATLAPIGSPITVGYHPDMLTFTPDGMKLIVANEGEARFDDDDNITDNPEGSVSIIDFKNGYANPTVKEVGFDRWNRRARLLQARGVLMTQLATGNAATVAEDLEPEYVAVADNGRTAWVALQENNAVAVIDLRRGILRNILSLGEIDHTQQILDASDKDSGIQITPEPVIGTPQPDAIAFASLNGRGYLFTANEGDARDFEEERVKKGSLVWAPSSPVGLNPSLTDDEELGRLEINTVASDPDGDGELEIIRSYGGRSMSIYRLFGFGRILPFGGTGSDMDEYTASLLSPFFHSNNDDNDSFESRSDAKGAEPEALTLAEIDGRTYAFIGLERQSAIMVYDVTDPANIVFQAYESNRSYKFSDGSFVDADSSAAGDLGPESIEFIPAADSPLGVPMIAVANEVSGTITLWRIDSGI